MSEQNKDKWEEGVPLPHDTNIASENINFIRVNDFVHVGIIKVCRKGDCKFR